MSITHFFKRIKNLLWSSLLVITILLILFPEFPENTITWIAERFYNRTDTEPAESSLFAAIISMRQINTASFTDTIKVQATLSSILEELRLEQTYTGIIRAGFDLSGFSGDCFFFNNNYEQEDTLTIHLPCAVISWDHLTLLHSSSIDSMTSEKIQIEISTVSRILYEQARSELISRALQDDIFYTAEQKMFNMILCLADSLGINAVIIVIFTGSGDKRTFTSE